ncbi:MAG TPA: phenylalanine--tRNA ligase subunit beta [Vicinamibacteria bacterium]
MKLPLSWLREYAPVSVEPKRLADDLTGIGLAVDGIETYGGETVLELDVTTNRVDCMNVYGVAREAAAFYGLPLRPLETHAAELGMPAGDALEVTLEAPELCGRFCARVLDVKLGPSPAWLRDRLELVGIRSINNVVDLTNYVMIETGQPSHAFDLGRVPGGALVVRWARAGERLTTLDGQERTLPATVGVIAGRGGEPALALAGVMGGASSEVQDDTRVVALEAAWWEPLATRRAARALGMHTEASHRFERGADVAAGKASLDRLAHLASKIGAGSVRPGLVERKGQAPARRTLRLRSARVSALLGAAVPWPQQEQALQSLGFEVSGDDREAVVIAPTWRLDVAREADLAEEVGRHFGLDKIPSSLPPAGRVGDLRRSQRRERQIRDVLSGAGLSEVVNYAFVAGAEVAPSPGVRLANPLTVEQDTLRTSLLTPGLVTTLRTNLRLGRQDVAVFEIGRVFLSGHGRPAESRRLGILLTGQQHPRHWSAPARPFDLFDALGLVELLFDRLGEPAPTVERGPASSQLHPGRSARLVSAGREIGHVGVLHPELASALEPKHEVVVLELELEQVLEARPEAGRFRALDRYPAVERDLSVVCDATTPAAETIGRVRRAAGDKLRSVSLVDLYAGSQLPPGKVSLTLSLRFHDRERTLTGDEVQAAVDAVIRELRSAGLEIRG